MPPASAQLLFYFNYILCLRGSGGVMVYSNVFHDITLICRTEKNAVRYLRRGSTLSTIKTIHLQFDVSLVDKLSAEKSKEPTTSS
ncbi:hypothetical protein OUZ56_009242 [Daphnia magna]|uniref:Secreted protein n=1 Tax=Daphnia magna TaxID=35525 RepID=A0ABR0AFE9_9CRUS|nr:hypothetical protein OUZ56_009242 [Daphnia magna]